MHVSATTATVTAVDALRAAGVPQGSAELQADLLVDAELPAWPPTACSGFPESSGASTTASRTRPRLVQCSSSWRPGPRSRYGPVSVGAADRSGVGTQVKGALDSVHAPTKGDIFIVIQPNSSDPITVVNA